MTLVSGTVASRADAVRNAIAITKMEGGAPSEFCCELLALYVSGEISGIEMRELMLRKARSIGPATDPFLSSIRWA